MLAATGDHERALDRLTSAETLAARMELRPWLGQILALEAAFLADLGRIDESAAKSAQCQELADEVAGLISDPLLRASCLAAART